MPHTQHEIPNYAAIEDNRLVLQAQSLESAESNNAEARMAPKFLLGGGFQISIAGKPVTLAKFSGLYLGGTGSEPSKDVIATLERLSVESSTNPEASNNEIELCVTHDAYNKILTAWNQSIGAKNLTFDITITEDSFLDGQYFFTPVTGTDQGQWGKIIAFKKAVTFSTHTKPTMQLVNGNGYVRAEHLKASNNFDISIGTDSSSSAANIVVTVFANNIATS